MDVPGPDFLVNAVTTFDRLRAPEWLENKGEEALYSLKPTLK
jgi:hypothetical protein